MRLEQPRCYVVTLTLPPGSIPGDDLIKAHLIRLRKLEKAGLLLLAGPFAEGERGGMIVLRTASAEMARLLAESDPFVATGGAHYVVRSLHPVFPQAGGELETALPGR